MTVDVNCTLRIQGERGDDFVVRVDRRRGWARHTRLNGRIGPLANMQIGPPGNGALDGAVQRVRTFGPIQRAEVALSADQTVIEIDAPRDRELRAGDLVGLQPRRYRIFAAQE